MDSYVYFTYANYPHWWTRFLKSGFSHVFILIPEHDGYILINPSLSTIEVKFLAKNQKLPKPLDKLSVMVKNYTDVNPINCMPWLRPITCVEVIKKVLGIKRWCIWTPYQLYRYLLWEAHQNHQNKLLLKKHLKQSKDARLTKKL